MTSVLQDKRIALVHDWLNGMRGGEKCLEIFCELYPQADLFTLFHEKGTVASRIESMPIKTSFIQKLPLSGTGYRYYLPFFPAAVERLRIDDYDLVVSLSHCVAKGVIPGNGACHVCYCLTPMRYIWDRAHDYQESPGLGWVAKKTLSACSGPLRRWDRRSSQRVGHFISISRYTQERISRYYGRGSELVYPPVRCGWFRPGDVDDDYYLVVSALVPYKRVDLAVDAFNRLGLTLKVVGEGPARQALEAVARPNVEFLGRVREEELLDLYSRCRALVFPGVDDFGLAALEAQSCGRPVIAYGGGGALETIAGDGARLGDPGRSGQADRLRTGVFFWEPTAEALAHTVSAFEREGHVYDKEALRAHALRFDVPRFKEEILACLARFLDSDSA